MAKTSKLARNAQRKELVARYAERRAALQAIIKNPNTSPDARAEAYAKLRKLPRNSAANRIRNRCEVTGRPRAFYRKLKMSRIALRELGNLGQIPGLTKSSW